MTYALSNTEIGQTDTSAVSYKLSGMGLGTGTTGDQLASRPRNYLNPSLAPLCTDKDTSLELSEVKTLRLVVSKDKQVSAAPKEQKQFVDGVVIRFDDASVECELTVASGPLALQLPRALFPAELRCGLPISLQMVEENGVRKPFIIVREIHAEDNADILAEFDTILAKFG